MKVINRRELFNILVEYINKVNPIGMDVPYDEYFSEAQELTKILNEKMTVEECAHTISNLLSESVCISCDDSKFIDCAKDVLQFISTQQDVPDNLPKAKLIDGEKFEGLIDELFYSFKSARKQVYYNIIFGALNDNIDIDDLIEYYDVSFLKDNSIHIYAKRINLMDNFYNIYVLFNPTLVSGILAHENCSYMFDSIPNFRILENIYNFDEVDSSNITDISYMFACSQYNHYINITSNKITNMSGLYYKSELDMLKFLFDSKQVTNMSSMFENAKINTLDLSLLSVENVRDIKNMLYNCKCTNLNASNELYIKLINELM